MYFGKRGFVPYPAYYNHLHYNKACAKIQSILQKYLLEPVLSIADPRVDKRIDFVGGIRGLSYLEKRCQEDAVVAISMYPVTMDELISVADAGEIMPPKSTWFEPKLRSGILIHKI